MISDEEMTDVPQIDVAQEDVQKFCDFLNAEFNSKLSADFFAAKRTKNDLQGFSDGEEHRYEDESSDDEENYLKEDSAVDGYANEDYTGADDSKSYQCQQCDYVCKSLLGLKRHSTYHSREKYSCPHPNCNYTNTYEKLVKKHIEAKHNPNNEDPMAEEKTESHVCEICSKVLKTYKILQKHMREVHQGEKIYCNLCPYSTKRQRDLNRHVRIHHLGEVVSKKEKPDITCELCGFTSKYKQNFDDHMDRKHLENYYNCKLCDFVARTRGDLREHVLDHRGIPVCPICGKTFERYKQYKGHMEKNHKDKVPKEIIQCDYCSFSHKSKVIMQKHNFKKHGIGELPKPTRPTKPWTGELFPCDLCGKTYQCKNSLTAHQRKYHDDHK